MLCRTLPRGVNIFQRSRHVASYSRQILDLVASRSITMKREHSAEVEDAAGKRIRSKSPSNEIPNAESSLGTGKNMGTNVDGKKAKLAARAARKHRKKIESVDPGSHDDVFWQEVSLILGSEAVDKAVEEGTDLESPYSFRDELELTISSMSSNGEGLAIAPSEKPWVIAVPFCLPGEKVRAKVYKNARLYSLAELVSVVGENLSMRDMSRVKCKYFGTCGGCQYQMLSYETQLDLKREVVVRAYELFSDLPSDSVPTVLPTAPSPLQYGYRTKITPHFDAPVKGHRRGKKPTTTPAAVPSSVPIGFNMAGKKTVLDIEECPIATPVINEALGPLRKGILENLHTYKKGVSLLLRNSLETSGDPPEEREVCVTNHKARVQERVGDKIFEYPASSFFQNNNSVLVPLTNYVHSAIFPSGLTTPAPTHLVDAYCGSGLFSITLSPYFNKIAGIELASDSIASATKNAQLNDLPEGKVSFRAGDAAHIFSAVPDFPATETAVIIDPPRKGCDENFIDQLLGFGGTTVVYVSCNVHTQARDIGNLLRKSSGEGRLKKYVLESIRGFDLFPQTAHVESVAVLRLVDL